MLSNEFRNLESPSTPTFTHSHPVRTITFCIYSLLTANSHFLNRPLLIPFPDFPSKKGNFQKKELFFSNINFLQFQQKMFFFLFFFRVIPRIFGCQNGTREIVKRKKRFSMIPKSYLTFRISVLKIRFEAFAWAYE